MTPGARLAAAAEILDRYLAGEPAERVLTTWARRSRFAGSGDRAAVRDHVFDAIRRRRSAAAAGGEESGRGLVIGLLRLQGRDPDDVLTGQGHSLPALTAVERQHVPQMSELDRLDCPGWLEDDLRGSLGAEFVPVLEGLQRRADVFLRVNSARGTLEEARAALGDEGIETEPHSLSPTALRVLSGARKVHASAAYRDGLVELQDAASQAVSDQIPLPASGVVLDYCAGGGGKALALAARFDGEILAHDADPRRMKDIPQRASRAGAQVQAATPDEVERRAPYGLVVADVPCSGSGAWRRQPEARWRLDRAALDDLRETQAGILDRVATLTGPEGAIAYITCSILRQENEDQVARFLRDHDGWNVEQRYRVSPLAGGDGFFLAVFRRKA
ncbi:RsmB/NOP family class I SAM-dependent RNA methyltransferase [Tropicimonas isoalkanivorans]|uniref:16S rRNA (Cytosine967-C5)-methyltransferase n=1 Tax=Tropicimonas isoalkanivorans TaxID=441112 RepID=A0A1I1LLF4_9RHOB|nr:RsmB/NOP family class I SAM-dependent RNA methyltransferase [Tropicimonas isoalkanivorans]SFC71818.1 16S rRNA (cytosine967-C5)-methyltransferase [Tropicimonas isoalkanivorans]